MMDITILVGIKSIHISTLMSNLLIVLYDISILKLTMEMNLEILAFSWANDY
jgi:hypothetical protein